MSLARDARQAFAVLRIAPCERPPDAGTLTAACARIPGVNALRIDAGRGRIHIIYDGNASGVGQVESVLQTLGLVPLRDTVAGDRR